MSKNAREYVSDVDEQRFIVEQPTQEAFDNLKDTEKATVIKERRKTIMRIPTFGNVHMLVRRSNEMQASAIQGNVQVRGVEAGEN